MEKHGKMAQGAGAGALQGRGERVRLRAALLVEQLDGDQIPMRFVRAGQTMPIRGFPHGVHFAAEALQRAVAEGKFDGAAIFFQHVEVHSANGSGRDVRDLAGVTAGAAWDEEAQAVVGSVYVYGNQAGRELQALAADLRRHKAEGVPLPDIGVSIDSFFVFERGGGGIPRAVRMSELLSVDVVFRPAADGRILASSKVASGKFENGGLEMLTRERVEEVLAERGVSGEAARVLLSAEYASEEALEQAIAAASQSAPALQSAAEPARVAASRVDGGQNGAGVASAWVDALRREAVGARLAASNLPAVVRQRLAAGNYDSPEQLDQAVQAARDELAALAADEVINVGGTPPRGSRVSGMQTGVDRVTAAWDWIFGVPDAGVPDPQLRDVRHLYQMMTGDYEWRGTFHGDRVQLTGATTATLADLAANAMNKVILAQFSILAHWRWYERVAFPTANDGSVQDMQWTTVGGLANLPAVPEKGAYDELDMGDVSETDSFVKYGGYVPITMELIRNSNIQRLQAVPRALALAAVRTRSAKVAEIFTSNAGVGPTLSQDSTALFDAGHSNLLTTAFGTDATAWRAARAECFGHTEVNSGKKLALFPRYWLGPAELYDTALSVFGYGEGMPVAYSPEAESRGFADPRPLPLAVPDFVDTTDWAYIVDPMVFPVIHISYAQAPGGGSHPAPELFTVSSPSAGLVFSNDVLPVKVRDWFAVGVNGPRGIGKRNVAGGS